MKVLVEDDRLHSTNINLFKITKKLGVLDMKCVEDKIMEIVNEKYRHITFEDLLTLTGKHFICCALNLDKCRAEYFSPETTPSLRCIDAIRASCCLPGIFQAQRVGQDLFTDGGSVDNFPLEYTQNYIQQVLGLEPRIFGVVILTTLHEKLLGLGDFIYRVIYAPTHVKNRSYGKHEDILVIEDQGKLDREELFSIGMKSCQDYLLQTSDVEQERKDLPPKGIHKRRVKECREKWV
jgi:predicted acylesterase/phospholipase RssA